MTLGIKMTLAMMQELLISLIANDSDCYKSWLELCIKELGRDVVDGGEPLILLRYLKIDNMRCSHLVAV